VNVNTGVVVFVATLVVNNTAKFPALKLDTVALEVLHVGQLIDPADTIGFGVATIGAVPPTLITVPAPVGVAQFRKLLRVPDESVE
jgi:hypothetical protein